MSSQPLPPEIADAIRRVDAAVADWPEDLLADWKKVRGFCRSKHSESQRVLPAASLVVQEIAQARHHAQNAMDAMSGVFGHGRDEEQPDTAKHRKLPDDGKP
jgi:hypothetical protein